MDISHISEEFIGRFSVSYKEGDFIYAYDIITHGLYKFTLSLRKADLIITPESIHQYTKDMIMGISKTGDEIILIPQFADEKWIFYNEQEKKIRYEKVLDSKVCITAVITLGSNLFLIPFNSNEPIIIVSLNFIKTIKIFENWNKNNEKKKSYIWSATSYDDLVFFPIVGSEKIVSVNCNEINIIVSDISDSICSISIYKEKIWILPTSGDNIYSIHFNGEVVDRIKLSSEKLKISAEEFCRIVVVEDSIFLFPFYDKKIYVYQLKRKELVSIASERNFFEGSLLARVNIPYWDFVIEKGILHLMPCEYRYMTINIDSLESREYALQYGNGINCNKYLIMIRNNKIDSFNEKRNCDIRDFFQYLFYLRENSINEKNENIGRKICVDMINKDL